MPVKSYQPHLMTGAVEPGREPDGAVIWPADAEAGFAGQIGADYKHAPLGAVRHQTVIAGFGKRQHGLTAASGQVDGNTVAGSPVLCHLTAETASPPSNNPAGKDAWRHGQRPEITVLAEFPDGGTAVVRMTDGEGQSGGRLQTGQAGFERSA